MIPIERDELQISLIRARIKPRLRRILRYVPEDIGHWPERDFLAVTDKSRHDGVLIYQGITVPFELSVRQASSGGRKAAIICDICASWRRGTESAVITFQAGDRRTVSYLVCEDLDCSLNVRDLTPASIISRSQLREDITPDNRVKRLHKRLKEMLANITH